MKLFVFTLLQWLDNGWEYFQSNSIYTYHFNIRFCNPEKSKFYSPNFTTQDIFMGISISFFFFLIQMDGLSLSRLTNRDRLSAFFFSPNDRFPSNTFIHIKCVCGATENKLMKICWKERFLPVAHMWNGRSYSLHDKARTNMTNAQASFNDLPFVINSRNTAFMPHFRMYPFLILIWADHIERTHVHFVTFISCAAI